MRTSQSRLVQKTLEYERLDAALASARIRLQALEAERDVKNESKLTHARAEVSTLSYKRAAIREELEAIERNLAD